MKVICCWVFFPAKPPNWRWPAAASLTFCDPFYKANINVVAVKGSSGGHHVKTTVDK